MEKTYIKNYLNARTAISLFNGTIGSNPISEIHLLLTSAGENWHLFDTIDIVKYNSGEYPSSIYITHFKIKR